MVLKTKFNNKPKHVSLTDVPIFGVVECVDNYSHHSGWRYLRVSHSKFLCLDCSGSFYENSQFFLRDISSFDKDSLWILVGKASSLTVEV